MMAEEDVGRSNVAEAAPEPIHRQRSQVEMLLRLTCAAELWHTPEGEPWASFIVNGRWESHAVNRTKFREWLNGTYFGKAGHAPSRASLEAAIETISARAKFSGPEHDVHVRIAGDNSEVIWLDLGDTQWRAVKITKDG